jgi:hypothetical protein
MNGAELTATLLLRHFSRQRWRKEQGNGNENRQGSR